MMTFLNVFTYLYKWVPALKNRLDEVVDDTQYYLDYFQEGNVFMHVFLVALIVAAVITAVYYWVCGNLFFNAAKRYIWLILLCVSFLATMFITPYYIVGHYDENGLWDGQNNTRLFESAKNTLSNTISIIEDEEYREFCTNVAEDYAKKFRTEHTLAYGMFTMNEDIPLEVSLINGLYAVIIFFILSLICKRFSIHCKAIPF